MRVLFQSDNDYTNHIFQDSSPLEHFVSVPLCGAVLLDTPCVAQVFYSWNRSLLAPCSLWNNYIVGMNKHYGKEGRKIPGLDGLWGGLVWGWTRGCSGQRGDCRQDICRIMPKSAIVSILEVLGTQCSVKDFSWFDLPLAHFWAQKPFTDPFVQRSSP